jgi:hypothetical protein
VDPTTRTKAAQKLKPQGSALRFLSTHAAVCNNCNFQAHLACSLSFATFGRRCVNRGGLERRSMNVREGQE